MRSKINSNNIYRSFISKTAIHRVYRLPYIDLVAKTGSTLKAPEKNPDTSDMRPSLARIDPARPEKK